MGGLTDPLGASQARAASADGSVVVGSSYSQSNSPAGFEAFRWDLTNGVVGLGDFPGGYFRSVAFDVSANGNVVVGFGTPDSITGELSEAFRWDLTNGMVGLGFLPGGNESEATGVSTDGSVIVGNAGRYKAFRWDAVNGMVALGSGQAYDVSADGSVVVGRKGQSIAGRWDATNGWQTIVDLLKSEGIDLTGWYLQNANAVSADGSTIVGFGLNPDGFIEAWVANISVPPNPNFSPIAIAGSDETVHPGTHVTLDGSASFDPDENYPLSYAWVLVSKPDGSTATLSGSDSMSPSFTADLLGNYTVELIVTDNLNALSVADQVLISTYNTPPVADPGQDQAIVQLGTTVQLDGCQSYDVDGDDITFSWIFTEKPVGSNATLNDSTYCAPTFTADVQGDYLLSLVVFDVFGASSESVTVAISFDNVRPVADAGVNQAVVLGVIVNLNGLGSSDANLDPLSFSWNVVSKPSGSTAKINDPTSAQTSFLADLAGTYIISLVVNDGYENSEPSNMTVIAIANQDAVTESLQEAITLINNISDDEFKNQKMKNTLTNKINAVLEMIDQGLYQESLDKLQNDILKKTNGCIETGEADKNDWIINCDDQNQVYSIIMEAIEHLTTLI